ncbi:MAG: class I SAM-dependent methyltransferase [Balneolaceae bacterium]|nr:class I SAM-dependent methyltransferase [Balneolaceae bacterium]
MQCRICERQTTGDFRVREMMFGSREPFDYVRCTGCGCVQLANIPDDLSAYYPPDYYAHRREEGESLLKSLLTERRNRYALWGDSLPGKWLYRRYPNVPLRSLSLLPLDLDTRILDVGCGRGDLLRELHELGFRNLLGVDPFNPEPIRYENGLTIRNGELEEVEGDWDLIMMHHAFEHVPDPREVLYRIQQLLAPGGWCLIRIPMSSSYAFEHFGEQWVQWDAPRHCYLHTPESMKVLARQSGLHLQGVSYDSTAFQFWGSLQYEQDIPLNDERSHAVNPGNSMFSRRQIETFSRRADALNRIGRGDQAVFLLGRQPAPYSTPEDIPTHS